MNAAIYCRVSTTMQEDNYSLPTQEDACRKHVESLGYTVAAVYQDVHSGYELWERPQLTALRNGARDGAYEAIIAYDPDRLSRRQVHYAVLVDECERHGVELLFVNGQHDKTAVGEFLANARAFAAELEREKFRERSQRGLLARANSGKLRPSNRPLYGYHWTDDTKGAYAIDDEKGAVVRRIFEKAAAGEPLRSIARWLDETGVPTPNGGAMWKHVVVRGILRHEAYMGVAIANRYADTKVGGKRKRIERPQEEHIALPEGTIPPIVSPELFATVQVRLTRNKAEAVRNNRDPEAFLLRSGFVFCGYCGKRIHTAWFHGRRGASLRPSYTVMSADVEHRDCPAFAITAKELDEAVWAKVAAIVTQPEIVTEEVARLRTNNPTQADREGVERAIAQIARKQANLSRALSLIDDMDAAAPLVAELKTLGDRKRELDSELAGITARDAGWKAAQDRLEDLQAWVGTVARNLDDLPYSGKRDLLTALDVKVKLYRADHTPRYEITASIPLDPIPNGRIVVGRATSSYPSPSSMASERRTNRSSRRRNGRGTPIPPHAVTASPAR